MRSKVTLESVTCDLEVKRKAKTAVPLSAKIFVKPPAPAYIHLLTLEDPFTVRQNSSSVMQTAP